MAPREVGRPAGGVGTGSQRSCSLLGRVGLHVCGIHVIDVVVPRTG